MDCVSNIALVSWTGSAGTEFYTATVTLEDGQSISCWSDSDQCGMPNVVCGQNYTVSVVASNENCNSEPSEADTLQSGGLHTFFSLYLFNTFYLSKMCNIN